MDLNLQDLKRIAEALEKHLELAKDDLAFRREQAAKGDALQATFVQTFLQPTTSSSPLEQVVNAAGRRHRRMEGQ